MAVESLGYMVLRTERVDEWAAFGTGFLGLQRGESSGSVLSLRADERARRIVAGPAIARTAFGWEVADDASLQAIAARLERAGTRVRALDSGELALRAVTAGIAFDDPAGQAMEVFHGAAPGDAAFTPGRPMSGFRTGALGLGHVVLNVASIDALRGFYQDLLGFRVSDWAMAPFKACFFHLNARHHSLAMIESPRTGIHHVMLETLQLDDVGQAYDLALAEPERIATTLGRHTNDFMTSFYARTPDDFMVEYGWGGRLIDVPNWRAGEMTYGPSLWGHERTWLPQAQRDQAREIRARAAADGLRQPVQVDAGNFHEGVGGPAWWETPSTTAVGRVA